MCGISFFLSKHVSYTNELKASLKAISHRGPDYSDIYCNEIPFGFMGLGHNRLSIIDLSRNGIQPMTRDQVTIAFNGEIYNYKEIKQVLIQKSYKFLSDTDTEVIINAYIEFGPKCFKMFKGMFSFIIIDERLNTVFIVRDLIGIKPIYLYQDGDSFFACSEIKGLKKFSCVDTSISKQDVFEFFNNGFLYEPSTGFENIKKIAAGHYLELDLIDGTSKLKKFAEISEYANNNSLARNIKQAVEMQEVADVPVGIFFSGGADSALLACFSSNKNYLFAEYDTDKRADIDKNYAYMIAEHLGSKLQTLKIKGANAKPTEVLNCFRFVAEHSEELISDFTFWSTYILSKSAKDQGYKVMLSGMGGDEVYAGYPRYLLLRYHNLIKVISPIFKLIKFFQIVPKAFDKRFDRLISYLEEKDWLVAYSRLIGFFSTSELSLIFEDFDAMNQKFVNKLKVLEHECDFQDDLVKRAQRLDKHGFLAHNLMVADKASMLNSLELRVPLLDENIFADGFKLERKLLISGKTLKTPIRKLLRSLLSKELVNRPKAGFNPPLDGFVNALNESFVMDELKHLSNIFDLKILEKIVSAHYSGSINNTYKIWQLLYFSMWYQHNAQTK